MKSARGTIRDDLRTQGILKLYQTSGGEALLKSL